MLRVEQRRNYIKVFFIIFCVLTLAIGVYLAWQKYKPTKIISKKHNIQTNIKASFPIGLSSDVLFFGNTFWGRYINDWSMASSLKYQYPFSRLNEFNRDQYDAWISGLECPTVAGVDMTSAEQEAALQFNCSPKYLSEAAKWFTAFTLANNHTDNQGEAGFKETQQQLEKNGIQYFGNYDYKSVSDVCEVVSLPVKITSDDKKVTKGSLPIALCAYHGVFGIPPAEAVAEIGKYSQYMPVVAMPHMGAEYKASPDELKVGFYRSLIDAGTDMVIGDHPHWIQTTENYKGHLIVYSMGNFMFDQQDTAEVVRSAGIRVLLQSTKVDSVDLSKWLKLGDSCKKYKDNCLSRIEAQKLTKIPLTYKFGVIGTNDVDKITKPATIEQQNSILQRLNWQSTIKNLHVPYSSL